MNTQQQIVYDQPATESERAEVAEACVLRLNFRMPMVLDAMSNEVDTAYSALPERLYLIDEQGPMLVLRRVRPGLASSGSRIRRRVNTLATAGALISTASA